MSNPFMLGDFCIWRLTEWEGPIGSLTGRFANATEERINAARAWLEPHFVQNNTILMGTQSFIIRTPQYTILVDACVGNDKPRADKNFHQLQTPYLDHMADLGFTPSDFDLVIITHMHVDHVGWCTRLVEGCWTLTFPNARHIFVQDEWDYWKNFPSEDQDSQNCIRDSIIPVVEAGKAEMTAANAVIADGVWLEVLPGHTPGHVAVHLSSKSQEMVIAGDLMHHPMQVAAPDWGIPAYDYDYSQATQTRKAFLERYANTSTLITCTHFPTPAFGRLVKEGNHLRFEVVS